jgi:hypothetical protein
MSELKARSLAFAREPVSVVVLLQHVEQRAPVADFRQLRDLGARRQELVHRPFDVGVGEPRQRAQLGVLRDVGDDVEAARQVTQHDRRDTGDEHAPHGARPRARLERRVERADEAGALDDGPVVERVRVTGQQPVGEVVDLHAVELAGGRDRGGRDAGAAGGLRRARRQDLEEDRRVREHVAGAQLGAQGTIHRVDRALDAPPRLYPAADMTDDEPT